MICFLFDDTDERLLSVSYKGINKCRLFNLCHHPTFKFDISPYSRQKLMITRAVI